MISIIFISMEKYIVKIEVMNLDGTKIGEFTLNTHDIEFAREKYNLHLLDKGISTIIDEVRETRRNNPHHHQNRVD